MAKARNVSNSTTNSFRKPLTAQEAVLAELRRRLIAGELAPGTQILQEALAEELGVSRVPIREALRTLKGEGQIAYEPHRGYFVVELDINELIEIYRLRDLLEDEATRLAFPHLTKRVRDGMAESMQAMLLAMKRDDIAELTAANRRFHFAIYANCQMPRLLRILEQLWDASDPYRAIYFCDAKNQRLMHEEHVGIHKATENGDAALLLKLLEEHRTHAVPALRRAFQPNKE